MAKSGGKTRMRSALGSWLRFLLCLCCALPIAWSPAAVQAASPALARIAPPSDVLDPAAARQAAMARLARQVATGHAEGWRSAELSTPVTLYDLTGAASAYLFPVSANGTPAGYLTVAAEALPNPVLEFAVEGATPLANADASVRAAGFQRVNPDRPLYLGLLTYGYEVWPAASAPAGERAILDLKDGKVGRVAGGAATPLWSGRAPGSRAEPMPQPGAAPSGAAWIAGVPDFNQYWGSYGCMSGCSPTAAVNVLAYYDARGYDYLVNGGDWASAVDEIRGDMGTYCDGKNGSTSIGSIAAGIESYARSRGYVFSSDLWCSWCGTGSSFEHYTGEIAAGRPIIVDFTGSAYGDHTVTGVGYDSSGPYMIVHDNWPNTGTDVYLQYGAGYQDIYMHPVIPVSGDSWLAEYWNNRDLSGTRAWGRYENGTYLWRDWGVGGPGNGTPADVWSARYSRVAYFPGGEYRFHCQHDDGCRIYVDGQMRLDGWRSSGFAGDDWIGTLPGGNHEVRVEYFEQTGGARLEAWWQGPGYLPREQACSPNRWCGQYWGNITLSGTPAVQRAENDRLDYNWGSGGPVPTFPVNGFSSRFTRQAVLCGAYTVHFHAGDGIRFWLDDQLVVDQWQYRPGAGEVQVGGFNFTLHTLRVEHFVNSGAAGVGLWLDPLPGSCTVPLNMVYLPLLQQP